MTCEAVQPELIGYHLGAIDRVARDALDAHLLGCHGCLARYLEVKRALEDGVLPDELPSPALRSRIRAEVAAQLPERRTVFPAWLWGAAAGAAAAFALAFALSSVSHHHRRTLRAPTDAPLIDAEQADTSLKVL